MLIYNIRDYREMLNMLNTQYFSSRMFHIYNHMIMHYEEYSEITDISETWNTKHTSTS